MNTKQILFTFHLTEEQAAAFNAAVAASGLNKSEFIRRALAASIANWPDDMPLRGKYERKR